MKNLKLVLKSLINNDACVEGGRHRPWWIGVIIFFFSMIVAIIPVFVQTWTKAGSSFANTATYNVDTGLQCFAEEANFSGITMIVKNNATIGNYIDLDQDDWNNTFTYTNNSGYHAYQYINSTGVSEFDVFYVADLASKDLEAIMKDKPVVEEGKETTYTNRTTSFIAFGKKEYALYAYNGNSSSAVASTFGDYKEEKLDSDILSVVNVTINGTEYNYTTITKELYSQYRTGVWNNWKAFFDRGYLYNKGQLTWKTTLLMFGINAGITVFMGLMIWILTRGKNNPFRIYTFLECQLIGFWATLSPSILALALGFLISSFSQIMFPLLLGVRVMWLSMKSLRPEYTAAPQQNQKYVKTVDTKPVKEKKAK